MELRLSAGVVTIRESSVQVCIDGGSDWLLEPPLRAQVFHADCRTTWASGSYDQVVQEGTEVVARGGLPIPGGGSLRFEDRWSAGAAAARVRREVTVEKPGTGRGFLSAMELTTPAPAGTDGFKTFMPATMYGDCDALPADAVGSRHHRDAGVKDFMVREDALPAPLVAAMDSAGAGLVLIHSNPDGTTNQTDACDLTGHTLVDAEFGFGSLGVREVDGCFCVAFWFPGTEGAAMRVWHDPMKRRFKPHNWRGRYHPLQEGVEHGYEIDLRIGRHPGFPPFLRWAWRAAFDALQPQAVRVDPSAVLSCIAGQFSANIEERQNGALGLPFLVESTNGNIDDGFYGLGFCARNEAVAYHLLRIGHRRDNPRYLEQGRRILDFWTSRTGPGFARVVYWPREDRFGGQDWFIHKRSNVAPPEEGEAVSLREMAEGHLGCLWAWRLEAAHGVEHPAWLAWCRGFGEWMLTQQRADGSFPRWWTLQGDVLDPSPTGSFNAIPFLCELTEVTEEPEFLEAAVWAGEHLWQSDQKRGIFVGGTIDNPDLLDKEAASISMEAYLALHEATGEGMWLQAARVAADVTETWMYVWNVPMPVDADPAALDWKPGASTIGLSCVAVGGGGVDEYLAFNVAEFARLSELTGDPHYLEVARLLLHNTKAMLALPGREYDLKGPGWQQEHWSISLNRGRGAHRYWLPWVTVCHLTGMARLQDRHPELWKSLS